MCKIDHGRNEELLCAGISDGPASHHVNLFRLEKEILTRGRAPDAFDVFLQVFVQRLVLRGWSTHNHDPSSRCLKPGINDMQFTVK